MEPGVGHTMDGTYVTGGDPQDDITIEMIAMMDVQTMHFMLAQFYAREPKAFRAALATMPD